MSEKDMKTWHSYEDKLFEGNWGKYRNGICILLKRLHLKELRFYINSMQNLLIKWDVE